MILYGVFSNTEHRFWLNYLLLIAKFSICGNCLLDVTLSFDSFLALIQKIEYSEADRYPK